MTNGMPDLDIAVTPKKLTKRQRLFVEYYLQYWDAQKAALAAGYSATTARAKSYKMLQNLFVMDAINERIKKAALDANEVLARLSQQATVNPGDFFIYEEEIEIDKNGNEILDENGDTKTKLVLKDVNWEMFRDQGHLIKKLSFSKSGQPVLEFHDVQNALIKMGQYHKLFVEKTENTNFNVEISADDLAKARDAAEQYEKDLLGG